MTIRTLSVCTASAVLLCGWALAPDVGCADDPMPAGVVAIVKGGPTDPVGKRLTFDGFCYAAAQQALSDLKRQRSGPRQILEILIEQRMVLQTCKRLGITITQAEMQQRWKDWDRQLRLKSNGRRTLRDLIKEEGTTEREFVQRIYHLMRKERIAAHPKYLGKRMPANDHARLQQIGIVIATIRNKTVIRYGVKLIDHVQERRQPDVLAQGVVATVDGEPITMQEFGRALVLRLPGDKVREYLDRECKTGLMQSQGVAITDDDLDAELEHLGKLWPLERELQRDEVWRTVSFKDRIETQFNMPLEDLKQNRYCRGLIGLVRTLRDGITQAEIEKEYETETAGRYGPYILVYDISIGFAQRKGFGAGGRSLRDAQRLANSLSSRLARGEAFDKIASELNRKGVRTLQARQIRLVKTNRDLVLHGQAARMRDGDVSAPFETLAEVHVMKRIGQRPGRTLAEVAPHVRELLARRKARVWIEEKLLDPAWVRLRWPLPERHAK